MQTLPLLIRLARQRADERRIVLAQAEQAHREAVSRRAAQAAAAAAETARAAGDAEEMARWSVWSRRAQREAWQLAQAEAVLAEREEGIRAALAEDFAEAKRLELAWAARQREAARHAARKAEKQAEEIELRRVRPEG
jgi:hypothetical protein